MEKNRRDVEERAEQLKSLGNLSALVAGFAVVAFLEFGDTELFGKNPVLTLAFGTTAALVVCSSTSVALSAVLTLHSLLFQPGMNNAMRAHDRTCEHPGTTLFVGL